MQEDDDFQDNDCRRTFLLTYSRAETAVWTPKTFSEAFLKAFASTKSKACVKEWACCLEDHADPTHKHIHVCVNLTGGRRWRPIKQAIAKEHGIQVNFATKTTGYVAAYRYVIKSKNPANILVSENHTNMDTVRSPRTKKAMGKYKANCARRRSLEATTDDGEQPTCSKNRRRSALLQQQQTTTKLSNGEIGKFIVKNNLQTPLEFNVLVQERLERGEPDLYNLAMRKGAKGIADIIAQAWNIKNAPKKAIRERQARIDIIRSFASKESCDLGDSCAWYKCAAEVLKANNVNIYTFASAMRNAFVNGRGKFTNILIVGPTNCGKSFLLNPIEIMFDAFVNPATGRYAWVGLDEKEVAYLNDFRWSAETIAWQDFLLLLEGQTVHLPRPKNTYSTDLRIDRTNTLPFFATSKSPIEYIGKYGIRDERESDMMASRWQTFTLKHQIPPQNIKIVTPCPRCFAKLVLEGSDKD